MLYILSFLPYSVFSYTCILHDRAGNFIILGQLWNLNGQAKFDQILLSSTISSIFYYIKLKSRPSVCLSAFFGTLIAQPSVHRLCMKSRLSVRKSGVTLLTKPFQHGSTQDLVYVIALVSGTSKFV